MSYVETPQVTLHNTGINYNDGAGAILDTEVAVPLVIVALGAIVTTATVVTTSPVIAVERAAAATRGTFSTTGESITIPTGLASGSVVLNRISNPTKFYPGDIYRMRVKTQGVGTAGIFKVFVVWKYNPVSDQSNVSVVTV